MLKTLKSLPGRNIKVSKAQMNVVNHDEGPLWIIAGPGSGKTEVLVLRCLKLLLVNRVDPRAIIVTTFTEKAGKNLQDRLILYKEHIAKRFPSVKDVDLTQLRVGTLHSLCNDILLEYRFPGYRNCRPMDDMEQLLFIYFHSRIAGPKGKLSPQHKKMFKYFYYMFDSISQKVVKSGKIPNRWSRARVAQSLFNRIVEFELDIDLMRQKGGNWSTLAHEFVEYEKALNEYSRVDFAHMQSKLLEFLATHRGELFVKGGAKPNDPGILHVFVDEYQDTNPIQSEIYFQLASREPHNLVVVGDDDQALYRFRGGTVESMITFDQMCKKYYCIKPKKISLVENYRSHPKIVAWCNSYINSFKTMKQPGVRVTGKPQLVAKSGIKGNWPAVSLIVSGSEKELAETVANLIKYFRNNGKIKDYSNCVLLIHSTRETKPWTKPYADALREKRISIYNPRARKFLEQEEIKLALGALLTIIDQRKEYPMTPEWVKKTCEKWREFYYTEIYKYKTLRDYVRRAAYRIIKTKHGEYLPSRLPDIFYHIINHEPFIRWCQDPERALRIGNLTSMIEAYTSTPIPGSPGIDRGLLRIDRETDGKIDPLWLSQLYNALVTLLVQQGISDPEEEEIICPKGRVPFMTVHQAKGLEFPIVFVAKIDEKAEPGAEHIIEDEIRQFRKSYIPLSDLNQRAKEDKIRFYYVAYSRAQYALFLLLKSNELNPGEEFGKVIGLGGSNLNWLKKLVTVWRV